MGIFDKAKDALSEHSAQVATGIDKAGDFVDEKTGGKYAEQVDQGQAFAKEKLAEPTATRTEPESTPEQPIWLGYLLARSAHSLGTLAGRDRPTLAREVRLLRIARRIDQKAHKPGCHDPRHPG